jgi:hypothetical protein
MSSSAWRAIISSSFVGMTQAVAELPGALMRAAPAALAAGPGAHGKAVEGRESHGGGHAPAAAEGAHRCPCAQMGDHPAVCTRARVLREHARDVLVRKTVQSIPLDPRFRELEEQREGLRQWNPVSKHAISAKPGLTFISDLIGARLCCAAGAGARVTPAPRALAGHRE